MTESPGGIDAVRRFIEARGAVRNYGEFLAWCRDNEAQAVWPDEFPFMITKAARTTQKIVSSDAEMIRMLARLWSEQCSWNRLEASDRDTVTSGAYCVHRRGRSHPTGALLSREECPYPVSQLARIREDSGWRRIEVISWDSGRRPNGWCERADGSGVHLSDMEGYLDVSWGGPWMALSPLPRRPLIRVIQEIFLRRPPLTAGDCKGLDRKIYGRDRKVDASGEKITGSLAGPLLAGQAATGKSPVQAILAAEQLRGDVTSMAMAIEVVEAAVEVIRPFPERITVHDQAAYEPRITSLAASMKEGGTPFTVTTPQASKMQAIRLDVRDRLRLAGQLARVPDLLLADEASGAIISLWDATVRQAVSE